MRKIVFAAGVVFLTCLSVISAQDMGSEIIVFEKGRMPQVTFFHHLHQEKLDNDCTSCHDLFPMQKGIIKEMISRDQLKSQQVMNEQCVECHRDRKKAGLATGPIKCTACHIRPK